MAAARLGGEQEGLGHGPALAVNVLGKVHAAFTAPDGRIHYARWTGSAWTPEEILPSPAAQNYFQHVAAAPNGKPHVVMTSKLGADSNSYAILYTTRQAKAWTEPIQLSTEPGAQVPCIAIGADNVRHVVYYSLQSGKIHYTRNDGSGWSAPQAIANGLRPEIVVDGNGVVHLVWMRSRTPYGVMYARRDSGGNWSTPINVARAGEQQIPTVAVDATGRVSMVWYRGAVGTNTLSFAQIAPDGVITRQTNVQGNFAFAHWPRIAVDCMNRVRIVYQAKAAANKPWRVYQRVFDGAKWSGPARLDGPEQTPECQVPDIGAKGTTLAVGWYSSGSKECFADVTLLECSAPVSMTRAGKRGAVKRQPRRERSPQRSVKRKTSAKNKKG
ncbi:MAG: hypothetical protein HY741_27130 [Chloroflexi bacterium]|nr:hypothetical protein [Chloroflexota bacterium]